MAYFTKQEAYDSARKAKLSTETYLNKLESIVESQNINIALMFFYHILLRMLS